MNVLEKSSVGRQNLYEKLIDAGYENVYYIVNEDNPEIRELPEKYRRNLVWKDSDRHLELIFESDTYIATESTEHALQLRIASKLVMDKIKSRMIGRLRELVRCLEAVGNV